MEIVMIINRWEYPQIHSAVETSHDITVELAGLANQLAGVRCKSSDILCDFVNLNSTAGWYLVCQEIALTISLKNISVRLGVHKRKVDGVSDQKPARSSGRLLR